jgi:tight adherence protein B
MIAGSFWSSPTGLLLVLGFAFSAVFLVVTMLLGGRERRRREGELAERLGRAGRPSEPGEPDKGSTATWVPTQFADIGERFATATGFSDRIDQRLERAGLPLTAGEYVALTAMAGFGGAIVAALLIQNVVFILLIGSLTAVIPWLWVSHTYRKRQQALVDQLADTLAILASSLRAGYSFLQALDTVSKEVSEPSAHEFQRVVAEIRLGRPVEEALTAMAERVGSDDLRWAVIAINVQRQVGGNLAEVLDIVASTVRERAYIRRQVRVLSAEGRISVAILSAIPFGLLLYIGLVNPEYVSLLFTRTVGLILLTLGGICLALGIFIMTRMVKIDV